MGKKRCSRGKPCGLTCIPFTKVCRINLPSRTSNPLHKVRVSLGSFSKLSPYTEKRVKEIREIVANLDKLTSSFSGLMEADKVNWKSGLGKGTSINGYGNFGAFVTIPSSKISPNLRLLPGEEAGIKYGRVTQNEVTILDKVGKAGIGPRLIAAQIQDKPNPGRMRTGVVAMTVVPGQIIRQLGNDVDKKEVFRQYLLSLSKLHSIGVSHNDAHAGNALYHNGKIKFVDFGLSHNSWRSALAEALKVSTGKPLVRGDEYGIDKYSKMMKNNIRQRVIPLLRSQGMTTSEARALIRSLSTITDGTERYFNDSSRFPKLSDDLAKRAINELYHGIE